jgi:SAM-dependent methyltransferase
MAEILLVAPVRTRSPAMTTPSQTTLLERAAPLFRVDAADLAPRFANGVLDLLGDAFAPTFTQRTLDTRATALLYDALRDRGTRWIGMPDFASETRALEERLALASGDVVLDVACGHGNFTVELARRVGPSGLVVGLDIAASMLARAASRVRRAGLDNVLLVRGDALDLPFRDAAFAKVNCSGGLHQMPDLDRALGEMARVARPGARFTGSSFARDGSEESGLRGWLWRRWSLHFVPVVTLARAVEAAGFDDVHAQMAGGAMGYAWGRRAA